MPAAYFTFNISIEKYNVPEMSAKRQFKIDLYDQLARLGNAMANGRRLELIDLLAQGERSVESLSSETEQPIANVSQHLQVLRRSRLVDSRRVGTYVYYRLANKEIAAFWASFRHTGESQLGEVRELVRAFFEHRDRFQAISQKELRKRLGDPGLVVVDVRPASEYESGHIAGARSIPISELRSRLSEIPKTCEVVAYCRGPYCVFADDAVRLLDSKGFKATRLDSGFPEWSLSGYPVSTEESQDRAAR
jgi:rhodanese-related sulfurtransferase